jgi:hypothetical protein
MRSRHKGLLVMRFLLYTIQYTKHIITSFIATKSPLNIFLLAVFKLLSKECYLSTLQLYHFITFDEIMMMMAA